MFGGDTGGVVRDLPEQSGLQSRPVSMESLPLGLACMWYLYLSGLGQVTQPLGCGRGSIYLSMEQWCPGGCFAGKGFSLDLNPGLCLIVRQVPFW